MTNGTEPSGGGDDGRPATLVIDIGGSGTKMLKLDARGGKRTERHREPTPSPAEPGAVLELIGRMTAQHEPFDRISVGFPGVVKRGVVHTAPNLGTPLWAGFDLQGGLRDLCGQPARVINDAELQGFGVIRGEGLEMVLTLGTGMGAGVYIDGRLLPNLELGHQPFRNGQTYEERIGNAARKRVGNKRWRRRVRRVIEQLGPIWNYDRLYIGGGNAKKLDFELPGNVELFVNERALRGGIRLWEDLGRGEG